MIDLESCLTSARAVVLVANTPRYLLRELTALDEVQNLTSENDTSVLLDELLARLPEDCDLDALTEVYVILAAFSMKDDVVASHLDRAITCAGSTRWVKQLVEMIGIQDRSTSHTTFRPSYHKLWHAGQATSGAHESHTQVQFPFSNDEESHYD